MLITFFLHLRSYRVPVSPREWLDFLAALKARLAFADPGAFYYVSRMCLVKDEKFFDRFDLAFDSFFRGLESWQALFDGPDNEKQLERALTDIFPSHSISELKRLLREYQITLDILRQRGDDAATGNARARNGETGEDENTEPGDGESGESEEGESGEGEEGESGEGEEGESGEGEEGEGTDGEFGRGSGQAPGAGIRDEADAPPQRSAARVWLHREYKDYDPDVELGTRNIKLALRRLRKFARESARLELDLHDTIRSTARNGGILDIKEIPERHNAVKVLLLLDVGGSMDEHVELCAQLFSAARSEFKYIDYYYFHNYLYESVWKTNLRRVEDRVPTPELWRRFGRDYKIVFVGDAWMGRQEIVEPGASVEHYNAEAGQVWMSRILDHFRKVIWLNPVPRDRWRDSPTIELTRAILGDHMYHLGVHGIEQGMKYLAR